MKQKFNIGDKVTWVSQAGGFYKQKTGIVSHIIPANRSFRDIIKKEVERNFISNYGGGFKRDHESYVVLIPATGKRGKPHLYWPKASVLIYKPLKP